MAKQKKPELVSLSELARRSGVSRQAVSMRLDKQERQAGIELRKAGGRRGRLVDVNDPLLRRYINNAFGKSKRKNQGNEDVAEKSEDTLRKLKFQSEKLRLQNTALHSKYLTKTAAWAFFEIMLEVEKEKFAKYAPEVLKRIEKECKKKFPKNQRERAKAEMDKLLSHSHETH